METEMLKQALDDCVINFDRRVLITDLLQEYRLSYEEVDEIMADYIAKEEKKGAKFEKSFLVSGEEEESNGEIYTVVKGDSKLKEWLSKLRNAESALYSVEISGGAKATADMFNPMKWCHNQMQSIETRSPLKWGNATNGDCNMEAKPLPKVEPKKNKDFPFVKKEAPSMSNSVAAAKEMKKIPTESKKTPPKSEQPKETTPEERKPSMAKPANKKSIASFFGPSESKKKSGAVKPPSPKKMQELLKKSGKPTTSKSSSVEADQKANISVQLFDNDDGDESEKEEKVPHLIVEVNTSDDEEQLESLRQECSKNDESELDTSNLVSKKRRRIIDSDDEDQEPEVKHEKKNEKDSEVDESEDAGKSETFLDEDGFVMTIKSKKASVPKKTVKPATPKKSPPSKEDNKKASKAQPKQTPKTKQGNIMNFFTKK